ncbi:uncharacterized protein [Nicotiana sylvestris]|uniref:uncharacterized protein n=1 Tax=Nicotiana sylvestris TaxID=4096 RepID=UPI00388C87D7
MAKNFKTIPQKENASSSSSPSAGLGDIAKMRPAPPGEEVAPKPVKDKKRRRALPSDIPKPKKSKARKSKDDFAALSANVAQKLRDEEEEGEDAGCELMPRKKGSIKALRTAGPVMVVETHPQTEEISKGALSKVLEPSGTEDISCRDEQLAVTLHQEAFTKSQAELSWCEANLKRFIEERGALKHLYVQKEEEPRDLRAELAQVHKEKAELDKQVTILLKEYGLDPTVEANTSISELQQKLERIELLRGEVDQVKADCDWWKESMDLLATEKEATLAKLSSAEVQLRSIKEKSSAQAKRIEELEARLAEAKAEVEKTKIATGKSIVVYLDNAEADQIQLREASDRERRRNDLVKCQSRRETLEEIHAQGFNLSKKIAQAKALEADARFLVSFDDDDDNKGSQGGSDNDEGPKGEAAPRKKPATGIVRILFFLFFFRNLML